VDNTSSGRPKFTENTEERRLSTSIRSRNHQVHAFADLETHTSNESVAIRRNNRNVLEDDVFRIFKGSFTLEVLEGHNFFTLLFDNLTSVAINILSYHNSLVSSGL